MLVGRGGEHERKDNPTNQMQSSAHTALYPAHLVALDRAFSVGQFAALLDKELASWEKLVKLPGFAENLK